MMKIIVNLKANFFIVFSILFVFLFGPCIADKNQILGASCSLDNSTSEYKTNIGNLLNSLAANAPNNSGFYSTSEGNDPNKVYGLTQCRADLSVRDCEDCIKNATLYRGCHGKSVITWFTWCFIRYSEKNFIGTWDRSALGTSNSTDIEDPNVVSRGVNFMNELASITPDKPLMFQTSVLDVGQSGKRYGLAQCTRDINKSDCGKCLDYQLATFSDIPGNRRNWDIYGTSCSLSYHDYQFYFNYSIPATATSIPAPTSTPTPTGNGGKARFLSHQISVDVMLSVLLFLLVL